MRIQEKDTIFCIVGVSTLILIFGYIVCLATPTTEELLVKIEEKKKVCDAVGRRVDITQDGAVYCGDYTTK